MHKPWRANNGANMSQQTLSLEALNCCKTNEQSVHLCVRTSAKALEMAVVVLLFHAPGNKAKACLNKRQGRSLAEGPCALFGGGYRYDMVSVSLTRMLPSPKSHLHDRMVSPVGRYSPWKNVFT